MLIFAVTSVTSSLSLPPTFLFFSHPHPPLFFLSPPLEKTTRHFSQNDLSLFTKRPVTFSKRPVVFSGIALVFPSIQGVLSAQSQINVITLSQYPVSQQHTKKTVTLVTAKT